MTTIFEYQPSYVKLPNGLKKIFPTNNPKWKDQRENQKKDPDYDDYSLFYDVFFDLARKNIWTVGPPLLSLTKKKIPLKIFYQGKSITYKYHQYQKEHESGYANCFQISANGIKKENPVLNFVGENFSIAIKVASFPSINKTSKLTMTLLQKGYPVKHIQDWILWHYRLYNFQRILFYDNGSSNIQEIKTSLKNLKAPELEIIFINWPYYYGGVSPKSTDLFAQNAQLNHSLRLYYKKNVYITSWDIDEYLVTTIPIDFDRLKKTHPYLPIKRYGIVDVKKQATTSIKHCLIREKKHQGGGKYFFVPKFVSWINSPHNITEIQLTIPYHFLKKIKTRLKQIFFYRLLQKNKLIKEKNTSLQQKPYLIHAEPIKVLWKSKKRGKKIIKRPFQTTFDTKLYIKDKNIQACLDKANL